MGYTTEFTGRFELDRKMVDLEIFDRLQQWQDYVKPTPIDGYCQWVLSEDRMGIEWDGNEKFYDYVEWLQVIMEQLLTPAGYQLTGKVEYQGEEISDHGWLEIVDGKVVQTTIQEELLTCPHCGEQFRRDEA